jgi:hypothetical protein
MNGAADPGAADPGDPGRDTLGRGNPPELLQSALEQLRLTGAIFFRSILTDAFAFESDTAMFADALHPGAERVILFHIVARGSCWAETDDGDRHWANEGDVIVLPYGDRYRMGGASPAECVPIESLIDRMPPWDVMPQIRHGGGGARTEVICGYLHSDDLDAGDGALEHERERAHPPPARARPDRGPAPAPREHARHRPGMARGAARPGARPGARALAP